MCRWFSKDPSGKTGPVMLGHCPSRNELSRCSHSTTAREIKICFCIDLCLQRCMVFVIFPYHNFLLKLLSHDRPVCMYFRAKSAWESSTDQISSVCAVELGVAVAEVAVGSTVWILSALGTAIADHTDGLRTVISARTRAAARVR